MSFRPIGFTGCSKNLHNLVELVNLVAAWEKRAEGVEFGHDAAEGEDVDWRVVTSGTQ